MKLQTRVNKKVGDKEYFQSWVVIPPKDLDLLDWEEGQKLRTIVDGKRLIIEPKED